MPGKLTRLQTQREVLRGEMKTFLDMAEQLDDDLSPEQMATLDGLKAKLSELDEQIALQEKQREWELSPDRKIIYSSTGEIPDGKPRTGLFRPRTGKPWTSKELFGKPGSDKFGSLDNYLDPIVQGVRDDRLVPALASQEGTGSAGGYAVPTQYSQRWLDTIIEESAVLSRCTIVPMTSNVQVIPGFDASSHASGVMLGGISGGWIAESGDIDYETPAYRKVELRARKLACLTACSSEVLADGISFAAQLESNLVRGMRWMTDHALISGTGAGQPRGLINDPAKIAVAAETGQATDTILYENASKMLARLHPSCWANAVWLCNPACVPQLLQMMIPAGTSGHFVQVLQGDETFRLLGRPVVFSEKCSALGDEGDIILTDLSQYCVGLRQDVTLERSAHVRFANDEVVFRAIARLDGQGLWGSVFTPLNGATQSWVVTLAAR